MTEEDEEFNRIERESMMRMKAVEAVVTRGGSRATVEMAREAAGDDWGLFREYMPEIHRLVELVRADERARMAEQPAQQQNGPINEGWQITVAHGHSGYGVYAHMEDYPEEGAVLVQAIEQPAKLEPVAWKWQPAPIRTAWGDEMVVASVAIDKDHTVCLYCEREQIAKVEVMFTSPPAQPQQEPVAWLELLREARDNCKASIVEEGISASRKEYRIDLEARLTAALNTSPPAQRKPLTDEEIADIVIEMNGNEPTALFWRDLARAIEAKLKEKNT